MIFAVDFDGTIVSEDRPFDDVTTPLQFMPGAREALYALKRAGHTLLLYSARTNRALLFTPAHDPLYRAGKRRLSLVRWEAARPLHWARYFQMLRFIETELPGVFDAIDDGQQGKPLADVYLDNNALRYGAGVDAVGWLAIRTTYGAATPLAATGRHHG